MMTCDPKTFRTNMFEKESLRSWAGAKDFHNPNIRLVVLNHDYLVWTIFDVNCIDGLHEVIVDFQGLLVSTELLEKTPPVITREQGSKKPEAPEELGGKIWRRKPRWCKPPQIWDVVWGSRILRSCGFGDISPIRGDNFCISGLPS